MGQITELAPLVSLLSWTLLNLFPFVVNFRKSSMIMYRVESAYVTYTWPPLPFLPPQCDTGRLYHCVHSARQGLCWGSHPAAVWCPPNIPQAFHSDKPLCNWPVLGERERRSLCPPSDHWRDRRCQPNAQSTGNREAIGELTVLEYAECLQNECPLLWYSNTLYTMSEAMLNCF